MSKIYQIELKTSVTETFTFRDKIVHRLELTPILDPGEMVELLKAALQQAGFVQEGETFRKKFEDDVELTFDLEKMEVSLGFETERELGTEVTALGEAWDSRTRARKHAQEQLEQSREAGRSKLEAVSRQVQQQMSEALAKAEQEKMKEVHLLLQQVYAESLKRKAQQLGDVVGIQESTHQGQYELLITIEQ